VRPPAWHLFVVRSTQRDALQQHLTQAGIGSLIHYPIPAYSQEVYAKAGFAADSFPSASRMADDDLSLPMGPHQTMAQTDAVVAVLAAH
jgi:dTDP-4-amino-4,6-dideoxygalactose transaminase